MHVLEHRMHFLPGHALPNLTELTPRFGYILGRRRATAQQEERDEQGLRLHGINRPNDPSAATAATRRGDCMVRRLGACHTNLFDGLFWGVPNDTRKR